MASAKSILNQLDILLNYVLDDPDKSSSQASLRTRWSLQKRQAVVLVSEVNYSHQRILLGLASLNTTTDVFAIVHQQNSTFKSLRSDVTQILPQGSNSNIKMLSLEMSKRVGHSQDQFRLPPSLEQIDQQVNTSTRSRVLPQDHQVQMQIRHVQNEPQFRHLEQVVSTIAPTAPLESFGGRSGGRSRGQPQCPTPPTIARRSRLSDQSCNHDCRCKCHSGLEPKLSTWMLSAFQSTIGSFSLVFLNSHPKAGCDIPSCTSQRSGQRYQVTYTFPSWIFHAAVSATYSDYGGTPELILRVLNRLSASTLRAGIFGYVIRNDTDNVKQIFRTRQASVFDIDNGGRSLLATALQMRHFDLVELLMYEGADPFQADDVGETPTDTAIRVMYLSSPTPESVRTRLETVLPMDLALDSCGLTELHKVAIGVLPLNLRTYLSSSKVDMINNGDKDNRTPLSFASARGDDEAVQALLEAGALPDISATLVGSPLHLACRNRHLAIVEKLLQAGADARAATPGNLLTPLHRACLGHNTGSSRWEEDNCVAIAHILLRYGVDIDAVDKNGTTPLHYAACYDHGGLVDFLVKSGATLHHCDGEGSDALMNAIVFNAHKSAAVLLRHDPNVGNIDDDGCSTLHYIARAADVEMMGLFIADVRRVRRSGLDAACRDNTHRTPLQHFDARDAISVQLREAFMHLLEAIHNAKTHANVADVEAIGDNDSEADEFHDALED